MMSHLNIAHDMKQFFVRDHNCYRRNQHDETALREYRDDQGEVSYECDEQHDDGEAAADYS